MAEALRVCIQRLDTDTPLPTYAYEGDAGLDLRAACDCVLPPGGRAPVPTGIKIAIPSGYAGFVLPRSGMAIRKGLSLVNTPGLIDSQYRGEVTVLAINHDRGESILIEKGERIAQLVILQVPQVELVEDEGLDKTARNEKGFGSRGAQ